MFGITALYITYYGFHVISQRFKFCKHVKMEFANVAVEPVGAPVCVVFLHLRGNFLNMSDESNAQICQLMKQKLQIAFH